MLRATRLQCNLFTGSEKPNMLTDLQIETLLLYKWPTRHKGASNEDREGIGGLGELMEDAHAGKDEEKEETEEMIHAREDRADNIDDNGWLRADYDQNELQLVAIDEQARELQRREDEGHLSKWYMCEEHGWKSDIKIALEHYVHDRSGRTHDQPNGESEELKLFMQTIKIKELPSDEKLEKLFDKAEELVKNEITAIPPLIWTKTERAPDDESELTPDEKIMNRVGFLVPHSLCLTPFAQRCLGSARLRAHWRCAVADPGLLWCVHVHGVAPGSDGSGSRL